MPTTRYCDDIMAFMTHRVSKPSLRWWIESLF